MKTISLAILVFMIFVSVVTRNFRRHRSALQTRCYGGMMGKDVDGEWLPFVDQDGRVLPCLEAKI